MRWDLGTFLAFITLGFLGAVAAYYLIGAIGGRRAGSYGAGPGGMSLARAVVLVLIGALVAPIVGAAISTAFRLFVPKTLGPSSAISAAIPWGMIVAFIFMLLGMAASYLNKLIDERRAKIAQLRARGDQNYVGIDFDVWDFVQPFLVSLVTFGAIVARTSESEMLTDILLGFQTGFFWQTVLTKRSAS